MKKYVLCTQSEQYRAADLYDALESYGQDTLYKRTIIQITIMSSYSPCVKQNVNKMCSNIVRRFNNPCLYNAHLSTKYFAQ